MKKIKIYPQIIDEYQSSEIAEQENLKEDWMGAKYWFENVVESDDEFELDDMPKYNRFICHMDYINSDLYYDYGAGYYFAVLNELKTENMKRNAIRLTESDLHRIIKESVKRVLNEGFGSKVVRNPKLTRLLNREGLGDILLCKDYGYFYIASDNEELANKISMLYSNAIYLNSFNQQSPEEWVEDIKRILRDIE